MSRRSQALLTVAIVDCGVEGIDIPQLGGFQNVQFAVCDFSRVIGNSVSRPKLRCPQGFSWSQRVQTFYCIALLIFRKVRKDRDTQGGVIIVFSLGAITFLKSKLLIIGMSVDGNIVKIHENARFPKVLVCAFVLDCLVEAQTCIG